jgi:hypothetical protein
LFHRPIDFLPAKRGFSVGFGDSSPDQVQGSLKSDQVPLLGGHPSKTKQSRKIGGNEMSAGLIDDFPPAPDRLVTLANWRQAQRLAFSQRPPLIPTATIAASRDPARL